jgi:hypothetical protein
MKIENLEKEDGEILVVPGISHHQIFNVGA